MIFNDADAAAGLHLTFPTKVTAVKKVFYNFKVLNVWTDIFL